MNKQRHAIAVLLALLTLAVLSRHAPLRAAVTHSLERISCGGSEALFPRTLNTSLGSSIVTRWSTAYHDRVRLILQEHLAAIRNSGTCDVSVRITPTPELKKLADALQWEEFFQEDFPALLLEHLRLYECALQTESLVAEDRVILDLLDRRKESQETPALIAPDIGMKTREIRVEARREVAIARRALHRALIYLSGYGRLQPLSSALQCLEGATLDIANNLSLATEASACLPRIWDVRTSLRTLPSP